MPRNDTHAFSSLVFLFVRPLATGGGLLIEMLVRIGVVAPLGRSLLRQFYFLVGAVCRDEPRAYRLAFTDRGGLQGPPRQFAIAPRHTAPIRDVPLPLPLPLMEGGVSREALLEELVLDVVECVRVHLHLDSIGRFLRLKNIQAAACDVAEGLHLYLHETARDVVMLLATRRAGDSSRATAHPLSGLKEHGMPSIPTALDLQPLQELAPAQTVRAPRDPLRQGLVVERDDLVAFLRLGGGHGEFPARIVVDQRDLVSADGDHGATAHVELAAAAQWWRPIAQWRYSQYMTTDLQAVDEGEFRTPKEIIRMRSMSNGESAAALKDQVAMLHNKRG